MKRHSLLTLAVGLTLSGCASVDSNFRYGEALQKSLYFFEAQQSGKLPSWNRVTWRGDSVLNDGKDVGLDLSGGWFDAGDHVKFGFPMAFSATMLAWGGVDYGQAYERAGQMDELQNNLRFVNDYFIAAHPSPNEFYGQVGVGLIDHAYWMPAEVIDQQTGKNRPAFKIDLECKGPDLAAETAAAMAASSMVFRKSHQQYSTLLLRHARELYALALATVGRDGKDHGYSNCITDAEDFYSIKYGVYWDEMAWGALWMYRATEEQSYLDRFKEYYPKMGFEEDTFTPLHSWALGWNDKTYGVYVLAAKLFGDAKYHTDARRWLDYWISPDGGPKTKDGLIVVDRFNGWGTSRYAANTAFLAFIYADVLKEGSAQRLKYHQFGKRQIDYLLGSNPRKSSYVVGFGNNPPVNVHHRGAHGSWANNISIPNQQRHILYGALVGGPSSTDDFDYQDLRTDYKRNEVATDYNAGFTGAVAALFGKYGGAPLTDDKFPPAEENQDEYSVHAKLYSSGANFIEIKANLLNKSTAPAQARSDLFFRYFVDLSELLNEGLTPDQVSVTVSEPQTTNVTQLTPWGTPNKNIFYTEIRFDKNIIYPGGQKEYRREVQFRISMPAKNNMKWDNLNDHSWDTSYVQNASALGAKAQTIPVYGQQGLLSGIEPSL